MVGVANDPPTGGPGTGRTRTTEEAREYASRPRRVYPWEGLYALFVKGEPSDQPDEWHFPTYAELARRFNLNEVRIRTVGGRDGWVADRNEFKASLAQMLETRKAETVLRAIATTDERALATARIGSALVFNRVSEIERDAATRAAARAEWERIRDTARTEVLTARAAVGPSTSSEDDPDVEALVDTREAADEIQRRAAEEMSEIDYDPWAPPVVDARELKTLAEAAGTWHALALKALGEPDVRRIELSGPDGAPMQVQAATIYQELTRDDPARLHALMAAFGRAVLGTVADEPLALVADADDGADPGDDSGDAA